MNLIYEVYLLKVKILLLKITDPEVYQGFLTNMEY